MSPIWHSSALPLRLWMELIWVYVCSSYTILNVGRSRGRETGWAAVCRVTRQCHECTKPPKKCEWFASAVKLNEMCSLVVWVLNIVSSAEQRGIPHWNQDRAAAEVRTHEEESLIHEIPWTEEWGGRGTRENTPLCVCTSKLEPCKTIMTAALQCMQVYCDIVWTF